MKREHGGGKNRCTDREEGIKSVMRVTVDPFQMFLRSAKNRIMTL